LPEPRVDQTTYPTASDFNHHFDPKEYLREMFSAPDDEDRFSLFFMARVLNSLQDNLYIHEFGGGPTLYSVAALACKARKIHFSDVVDASLQEVRAWLNGKPDAHDWTPYIALALEAEGSAVTETAIAERAALMRKAVTHLMHCDAQKNPPIELENTQYDLVTAHHCTDVAATNIDEWQKVIKNVTTIVRPGGWLMLSVTTGARTYEVGDVIFQCVDLTKEDIQNGLLAAGYLKESIILETYDTVEQSREYAGIIMALARRG
jgi:nicotinamide N-methyltransferase/methyltransferase